MSEMDTDNTVPPSDSDSQSNKSEYSQLKIFEMSVMPHLGELRVRIIRSLVFIFFAFFVSFYFREYILAFALKPYGADFHPVVLDPTERFFNYFKITMSAGLIAASPYVLGELWGFILPALLPHEKRVILPILPIIFLLFILGASFGYFLVLPVALNFLLDFGSDMIVNQIRLDRSVNFVVQTCLACGIIFQLPVIVFLLAKVGIVKASFLRRKRKISIVTILIIAAALTPTPDPFTMMLVASPMFVLYEISVFVAQWARREPKHQENETSDQ